MEILKSHCSSWTIASCSYDDEDTDSTYNPDCDSYSCRSDCNCFCSDDAYYAPEHEDDNDAPAKRYNCSDAA